MAHANVDSHPRPSRTAHKHMHGIMIVLYIHNMTYLRANIKPPLNEYGYFINNLLVNYLICYSLMESMVDDGEEIRKSFVFCETKKLNK